MNDFEIKGNIIDIINREIFPGSLFVKDSKITRIEKHIEETYDLFIMPGLIDSHIHIESSMLVPSEFAKIAVKHGTVATVSDPHEIANVLGINGVEYMINNGNKVPFKFYFGASSCVPATTFETSGAELTVKDIDELLSNAEIKYLSEMMNFPGVINDFPDVIEKLNTSQKYNKPVDGHAPGLSGEGLKKYVKEGISTDHECFTLEEALEKISLGMKILIREGSAAKNFEALHPLIKSYPEMIMFCSDDLHPDDLIKGHINITIKRALKLGYDVFDILRAAILNPIKHYNLEVGCLQEGDHADFIIIDNIKDFNILKTYIDGELVFNDGEVLIPDLRVDKINKFNIRQKSIEDFRIKSNGNKIRVIEALDGQLITNELICEAKTENGYVIPDTDNDILKITVVNRYEERKPSIGFIKNFGLKKGAIASSVAHDSHNIIAVGTNDEDICNAVNAIIKAKGGMAVSINGNTDVLALPVAGLITDENAYEVAGKYSFLTKKAKELGSKLNAPFMTLSFMALLVIPKLKLSDKGLFDGEKFDFIELFVQD
jgi:adenine deaminase